MWKENVNQRPLQSHTFYINFSLRNDGAETAPCTVTTKKAAVKSHFLVALDVQTERK